MVAVLDRVDNLNWQITALGQTVWHSAVTLQCACVPLQPYKLTSGLGSSSSIFPLSFTFLAASVLLEPNEWMNECVCAALEMVCSLQRRAAVSLFLSSCSKWMIAGAGAVEALNSPECALSAAGGSALPAVQCSDQLPWEVGWNGMRWANQTRETRLASASAIPSIPSDGVLPNESTNSSKRRQTDRADTAAAAEPKRERKHSLLFLILSDSVILSLNCRCQKKATRTRITSRRRRRQPVNCRLLLLLLFFFFCFS